MCHSNIHQSSICIHHNHPLAIKNLSDLLITSLPQHINQVTILCIGTDRSTGDSLGPMTGTLLMKMKPKQLKVQGTLSKPVHALNLDSILDGNNAQQQGNFMIALDASLGKQNAIGYFQSGPGPILPGAALNKQLPAVGDAFLTGIVNLSGLMEHAVLQNTRLSLVYDMAYILAKTLFRVDVWLQKYHMNRLTQEIPLPKIDNQHII